MKKVLLFIVIFFLFALLASIWIAPFYEERRLPVFSYLTQAFVQCVSHKMETAIEKISHSGGYVTPHHGTAHELVVEQELESIVPSVLSACEGVLNSEDFFIREIKHIRVSVEPRRVSVFLDGQWVGKNRFIVPGFTVQIETPLGEMLWQAKSVIQTIEETGLVRDAVLSALGKEENELGIKQKLSSVLNKKQLAIDGYAVAFAVLPEMIVVNMRSREITFPLTIKIKREKEFWFSYLMTFTGKDFFVGCSFLGEEESFPEKDILFDCGWYTCNIPWQETVQLPMHCASYDIYLDGVLYEK